jgi:hypothetical protein
MAARAHDNFLNAGTLFLAEHFGGQEVGFTFPATSVTALEMPTLLKPVDAFDYESPGNVNAACDSASADPRYGSLIRGSRDHAIHTNIGGFEASITRDFPRDPSVLPKTKWFTRVVHLWFTRVVHVQTNTLRTIRIINMGRRLFLAGGVGGGALTRARNRVVIMRTWFLPYPRIACWA